MSKRFRIALSYSGTRRPFVAETASALAARFGQERILYDKYHQAEFARGDLATHLPALYYNESDLIVAVLSQDYETKEWCGLEWNAIFGLLKKNKHAQVMLCRFDRVDAQGLFDLAGFVDLDDKSPGELATLIAERLAINEGRPRNHYAGTATDDSEWPVEPPPLDWPVADHTDARRAFAQLITRNAPFRLLPIHGGSETGKSHLTKQFLRNALKIPDLTCGRFDFKGSADMDGELKAFADRLGVPAPAEGTGVSSQLAQIFAALKKNGRPTLLIFDTFELAGEAERWVKDNLLLAIVPSTWLRIIVVGQRVPSPHGEPWAGDSSPPIELRPPTPEEWFAYGQPLNRSPEFTLELVKQVHAVVSGKSSVIAQLCRPGS